jgi:hypothetical protein
VGDFYRTRANHQRAYLTAHGDPIGKPCHHCGRPILHMWKDSDRDRERYPFADCFSVHHIDYDPTHNDPANLAASHMGCNAKDQSEATREKMRESGRRAAERRRGQPVSAEGRARNRESWTPEKRAHHAEIMRQQHREGKMRVRFRCDDCGLEMISGAMASHQRAADHHGRTRVG